MVPHFLRTLLQRALRGRSPATPAEHLDLLFASSFKPY